MCTTNLFFGKQRTQGGRHHIPSVLIGKGRMQLWFFYALLPDPGFEAESVALLLVLTYEERVDP